VGDIGSSFKRATNFGLGRGFATNEERREAAKAKIKKKKDKMFQNATMPDEEDIRRVERRKAAKRRGSRANTILTDRETLG
jgi:hypothetical protein